MAQALKAVATDGLASARRGSIKCPLRWSTIARPLLGARRTRPTLSRSRLQTATLEIPATASADNMKPHQSPVPATDDEQAHELFDWFHQWYPVAATEYLKHDQPNKIQLLDMDLVLWKDTEGNWCCHEDLCPHRLAPLSEGRLHPTLGLQCSYHGWTFGPDGSCTSIPQIGDPKAHATACSSQRGCLKRFPVQELHGLVWVYADSSADSWLKAAAGALPDTAAPQMTQEGWTLKSPWFQRDIPLGLDILVENFTDPSHVPFSHHGVVGDRDASQNMTMRLETDITKEGGFRTFVDMPVVSNSYHLDFKPPCLATHHFPGVTMLLYGYPTTMGWSRVIMSMIGPKDSKQKRPATPQLGPVVNFLINASQSLPFLEHAMNRNAIIDGDSYFLHAAERILYRRGDSTSWNKQYYMPSSADVAVVAWRKWLDQYGRNLPTLPQSSSNLPPLMPREKVFDRYNQHTKDCPHCSSALRMVNICIGLAAAVAAVAVAAVWVAATAAVPRVPLMSVYCLGHMAAAGLAAAVAELLMKFRRKFLYEDYVHAEH